MEGINQKKSNIQSSNKYTQEQKKIALNEKQSKQNNTQNLTQSNNYEIRNKQNSKLDFLGQVPDTYYNEVMAAELKNLSRENAELKFCLEKLNKKFEKEMKDLKIQNSNKIKEINSSKEIIKRMLS